ncbi:MAG: hypothetical protein JXA16_03100 [Bacteroidales bacterium]|nr:hypothetical protein [Bacteroidales bacterium]
MKYLRNRIIALLILIFFYSNAIFSQSGNYNVGARSSGLSGASVSLIDVWSQYYNQAGLAYLDDITVGLAYKNEFFVKELATNSIAVAVPTKTGTFGLNYNYFGYPKFNENKIALAYAKSFGKKIAVGIQLDYIYTHIEGEYGNQGVAAGEIGILSNPYKDLYIAAHVFNIWNAKVSEYDETNLPVIFKLGASYKLYEIALLSVELEKDIDYPVIFKTGVEFEMLKKVFFRAGVAAKPTIFSFGLGYAFNSFKLDIAFSKHEILDYSPSIGLRYQFKK